MSILCDPRQAAAFPEPRRCIDWRERFCTAEWMLDILKSDGSETSPLRLQLRDPVMMASTMLDWYLDLPSPSRPDQGTQRLLGKFIEKLLSKIHDHLVPKEILRGFRPSTRALKAWVEMLTPSVARLEIIKPPFLRSLPTQELYGAYLRGIVRTSTNFTALHERGPFKVDGTVDWLLTNAISCVISMWSGVDLALTTVDDADIWYYRHYVDHRRELSPGLTCPDVGLCRSKGWTRPSGLTADEFWDWAEVQGSWDGICSSLERGKTVSGFDFLYTSNLIPGEDYPDGERLWDSWLNECAPSNDDGAVEACNDIQHRWCFHLRVVTEDELDPDLPPLSTSLPTSSRLPPIYFESTGGIFPVWDFSPPFKPHKHMPRPIATTQVRGVVRLTADDPPQIRWTFIFRHHNADQWQMECVQPCGRASKRGLFGIWHKLQHCDPRLPPPHGPVWFWKLPDGDWKTVIRSREERILEGDWPDSQGSDEDDSSDEENSWDEEDEEDISDDNETPDKDDISQEDNTSKEDDALFEFLHFPEVDAPDGEPTW